MAYNKFEIIKSKIFNDVYTFKPSCFNDHWGSIYSAYTTDVFKEYFPKDIKFVHDKFVKSHKNVLRGLHGDDKTWKLVSCVYGEVFQVIVDCRTNSKTYMKSDSLIINNENKKMLLVPPGFANGFYVMSEIAVYYYKLAYKGAYNDFQDQFTLKWNDDRINLIWPTDNPILSSRDS